MAGRAPSSIGTQRCLPTPSGAPAPIGASDPNARDGCHEPKAWDMGFFRRGTHQRVPQKLVFKDLFPVCHGNVDWSDGKPTRNCHSRTPEVVTKQRKPRCGRAFEVSIRWSDPGLVCGARDIRGPPGISIRTLRVGETPTEQSKPG